MNPKEKITSIEGTASRVGSIDVMSAHLIFSATLAALSTYNFSFKDTLTRAKSPITESLSYQVLE